MPAPKDSIKCKLWKKRLSKSMIGKRIGEKNPNYNKPMSQKQKDQISKTLTGKYIGEKSYWYGKTGEKAAFYGKYHTQETKDKKRKALMGRKNPIIAEINRKRTGELNPRWRGGVSFEPYTSDFNKQLKATIRHRDGYKCQKCGCPEIENNRRLDSHHIDYDKQNCKPFNLISLCKRCNTKVNSNRPYWTRYFTKKIRKIMTSSPLQLCFNYTSKKKKRVEV